MNFIDHTHFTPFVNQTFTARISDTAVEMALIQVHVKEHLANAYIPRVPFTLVFRSALRTVLPQSIYQMSTAGMEALGIFLIPVGMDTGGVIYHAIYS